MLEEAGCELAGWPLDLAEQDPLAPLRSLVVAGGLTVAVNAIVRIQAGVRGWIGRRVYGMVDAFLEDLQRAVMRIQAGVRD